MPELGGRLSSVALPIQTERLSLRLPRLSDVPALVRAGNYPEVARGTFVPHPLGPSDGRVYLQRLIEGARGGAILALLITERSSGRVLGLAGISNFRPKDPSAEVFYWLSPPEWGHGYATEAARALVALGFDQFGLHRIGAHVLAYNGPSVRVLRRLGFKEEGRSREMRKDIEGWQDELHFGILEREHRRHRVKRRKGSRTQVHRVR